jgi:8-oxo-dGTP pyrophosphatase MutT (NUDIX family)
MPPYPFILDFFGEFPAEKVRVVWHESAGAEDPQIERLKAAWPEHVAEAVQQGRVLFNGPMVRWLGHRVDGGQLVIEAGPTDYATFYCTNYLNHALGDRIGWERFANPIGISANVITSDGWLLYGRRNQKVACHAGWVHPFGGTVDPTDRDEDGGLDLFAGMARELREELNLSDDELAELVCLGMIRDPEIRQPELVFDARVCCSRAELEARIQPDDAEHIDIAVCADDADVYLDFLRRERQITPIAIGSLCLHARRVHGEALYDRMMNGLLALQGKTT